MRSSITIFLLTAGLAATTIVHTSDPNPAPPPPHRSHPWTFENRVEKRSVRTTGEPLLTRPDCSPLCRGGILKVEKRSADSFDSLVATTRRPGGIAVTLPKRPLAFDALAPEVAKAEPQPKDTAAPIGAKVAIDKAEAAPAAPAVATIPHRVEVLLTTKVKPEPAAENPATTPSTLDREASITKTPAKPAPGPQPAIWTRAPAQTVVLPVAVPISAVPAEHVPPVPEPVPAPAPSFELKPEPVPAAAAPAPVPKPALDETNSMTNKLEVAKAVNKTEKAEADAQRIPLEGGPCLLGDAGTARGFYLHDARAFYGKALNHLKKGKFGEAFDLFAAKLERAFPGMLSKELLATLRAFQNISEDKRAELQAEVKQQAQAYITRKAITLFLNPEASGFLLAASTTFENKSTTNAPVLRPYLPAFVSARKQFDVLSLSAKQALIKAFPHLGMLDEMEAYIKVFDDLVVHLKGFCENLPGFEECDQLRALY